jgi:NADPH:quinone reductase-like Zn-dependent oxidoreductase
LLVAGIEQWGDAVRMLEVADPSAPRAGEILIEVRAAGVGNWDDIARAGNWDLGRTAPLALGVEAAGVVAAVGTDVDGWSAGDEVLTHPLPLVDQGTWAPWLLARATAVARKPSGVSWAIAGPFPVPALTAAQALDEAGGSRPGVQVLVNGAGGVTGGLAVSLAVLRGARVLATAGPSSRERVLAAGAAAVIDYHDPDWPEQIIDASGGGGVDAAVNAARGGAASALRAVRDGGRLATITSDPPGDERGITITSVYVRPDATQLGLAAAELAAGRLEFAVGARFPLAEARAALARAVAGLGGAVALEM